MEGKTVKDYTARKIKRLEEMKSNESRRSMCRAELAKMRRGIGKKPGELPELWGMLFESAPDTMIRSGTVPSKEEWAIYVALTLYALHSQGGKNAYSDGQNLGSAAAKLARKEQDKPEDIPNEAILRRFNAMATSADMDELSWHLRGMVQLLRREDIPVDYAELSQELYEYQYPESGSGVRLKWGREFYREFNRKQNTESENDGKDENNE